VSVGSAGANTLWIPVLKIRPAATVVASPLAAYGSIGVNDSGLILFEGRGFSKVSFQIAPEPPTVPVTLPNNTALPDEYGISVYYTVDTTAKLAQPQNPQSGMGLGGPQIGATGWTGIPVGSWVLLPAADDQSGTGVDANPMTSTNPGISSSRCAGGYRVVLTANAGGATAGLVVYAMTVP
jgi:hypothetical protein